MNRFKLFGQHTASGQGILETGEAKRWTETNMQLTDGPSLPPGASPDQVPPDAAPAKALPPDRATETPPDGKPNELPPDTEAGRQREVPAHGGTLIRRFSVPGPQTDRDTRMSAVEQWRRAHADAAAANERLAQAGTAADAEYIENAQRTRERADALLRAALREIEHLPEGTDWRDWIVIGSKGAPERQDDT